MKIVKIGEFYLSICGAIGVHKAMQEDVKERLKDNPHAPIEVVAQWATSYFRRTSTEKLEKVGEQPKEKSGEEYERWVKRYTKWENHHNTVSLICGFDENVVLD